MTDFWSAAQEGLQAYTLYHEAEQNVREVVSELSRQIEAGTNGHLKVGWEKRSRDQRPQNMMERATFQPPPQESYRALVVRSSSKETELARLTLDERGWPVDLRYAGMYVSCHDREALENALGAMLKHPQIGRALRALLGTTDPPKGGPAPEPAAPTSPEGG